MLYTLNNLIKGELWKEVLKVETIPLEEVRNLNCAFMLKMIIFVNFHFRMSEKF